MSRRASRRAASWAANPRAASPCAEPSTPTTMVCIRPRFLYEFLPGLRAIPFQDTADEGGQSMRPDASFFAEVTTMEEWWVGRSFSRTPGHTVRFLASGRVLPHWLLAQAIARR